MVSPAIEARGLAQTYGKRRVFDGLDLCVDRGTTVGLLGPNGAGKTTLLSVLSTLRPPARGSLSILGIDAGDPHERRRLRAMVGFLPQSFGYDPRFTVGEFVAYAAWLKKVPSGQVAVRVAEAVQAVGLGDRTKDALGTLSGGMLRRAGIAASVVCDPPLLILDEPTAGLDPAHRVEFRQVVRRLGEHTTVLVSTHLVEDIGHMCDRVVVLDEGRIRYSGTPAELTRAARPDAPGDSELERGYSSVLVGGPA